MMLRFAFGDRRLAPRRIAAALMPFVLLGCAPDSEPTVHFIGLSTWTPERVRESMARVAPDVDLVDAACATVLREELGFPQAAKETYVDLGLFGFGSTETHVISVVEPQEAWRVQPLSPPPAALPERPEWAEAIRLISEREANAVHFLQFPEFFYEGRAPGAFGEPTAGARQLQTEIARLSGLPDALRHASRAVQLDANPDHRMVGALILGHFPEESRAWWALVRSLRRVSEPVPVADMMLRVMSTRAPDELEWRPELESLRALVSGTNLFAYLTVLEALTATRVDPALGRTLIEPGSLYLRGNLEAPVESRRRIVREFLRQVSGDDFGADDAAWLAWLDDFSERSAEGSQ